MLRIRMLKVITKSAGPSEVAPIGVRTERVLEDHHRQIGHGSVHIGVPELVVERGEQQGRGFAADARHRQQDAGDDAAAGGAIDHIAHHLPLWRAEAGGGFAQGVGHQIQHVLGGAQDHGDHQERQRDRSGPRREMAHANNHQLINEEADDDRRRAEEDVVDEANDGSQRAGLAVFREIRAGKNADRRTEHDAEKGHHQAAVHGIEQAAGISRRRRAFGEQLDVQGRDAVDHQGAEDRQQPEQADQRGNARRRQRQAVFHLTAFVQGHGRRPALRCMRIKRILANASTAKVMTKSSKPSAISELV